MSSLYIGISGWNYPRWRGSFYPRGLVQKKELEYSSRVFNSIEINGSFYSLQTPTVYREWHRQTPENFVFSVKGSRFISHMKKLRDVHVPLANFFASGVLELKDKLGPILWQLPPQLKFDPMRLRDFFQVLPRSFDEAQALALDHDERVQEAPPEVDMKASELHLRYAVEIRDASYMNSRFIDLLREYEIAAVIADSPGKWPYFEDLTSSFVYLRLHGDQELYASGYNETSLQSWAQKIRLWSQGIQRTDAPLCHSVQPPPASKDVYVYFDNDINGYAPLDAMLLARLVRQTAMAEHSKDNSERGPVSHPN